MVTTLAPSPTVAAGFAERLRRGDRLTGTFVRTPHPHVVEVLCRAELDVLCIDAEHAPFDRASMDACILAARSADRPILVRPPSGAAEHVLNALDLGATGVVIPHVIDAATAAATVRSAHFGPNGRGYSGLSRAAGHASRSMRDHLAASRRETAVVAMIEDADAIGNARSIAAVPGIDAILIGRSDLAVSLGHDRVDHPEVVAAVQAICRDVRAEQRAVAMFVPHAGEAAAREVADWAKAGASLFILGSDQGCLQAGANQLASMVGGALADLPPAGGRAGG